MNLTYLLAAYGVFWVLLSIYIYSISRRQKALERDLQRLLELDQ